jgi:hypothetical protein
MRLSSALSKLLQAQTTWCAEHAVWWKGCHPLSHPLTLRQTHPAWPPCADEAPLGGRAAGAGAGASSKLTRTGPHRPEMRHSQCAQYETPCGARQSTGCSGRWTTKDSGQPLQSTGRRHASRRTRGVRHAAALEAALAQHAGLVADTTPARLSSDRSSRACHAQALSSAPPTRHQAQSHV